MDAMLRIGKEEGFASLYRGVIVNMVAGSLANSIFFYVYSDGKRRYNYDPSHPYSLKTIFISMRAGFVSMTITAPLWCVKTRMVLYREQSGLSDMWRNEGVRGFYHGYIPSLFMSTYGVIQMFCYENINYLMGFNNKSEKKDMWIPFLTGGISKCVASVTLLPLNVVRMRLQMKKYSEHQVKELGMGVSSNIRDQIHYKGVADCFRKIYKNEGIFAFYKGLTPLVMKVFPSSGVFFFTYEMTLKLLNQNSQE